MLGLPVLILPQGLLIKPTVKPIKEAPEPEEPNGHHYSTHPKYNLRVSYLKPPHLIHLVHLVQFQTRSLGGCLRLIIGLTMEGCYPSHQRNAEKLIHGDKVGISNHKRHINLVSNHKRHINCFRKHTRIGKPTSLHVDKVIKNVQAPPLAKRLWNDIIEQSKSIAVSKECQSLCFENIVKLYMYGCSKFQILPFVVLQPDFWF
jgi:hypothetical protein